MENEIMDLEEMLKGEMLTVEYLEQDYHDIIGVYGYNEITVRNMEDLSKRHREAVTKSFQEFLQVETTFETLYTNQVFGLSKDTNTWVLIAQENDADRSLSECWDDSRGGVDEYFPCIQYGDNSNTLKAQHRSFVEQTGYIYIQHVDNELRNNKEFMLNAIKANPLYSALTGFSLRLDKDFVKRASELGADTYSPDLSKYPDHASFFVQTSVSLYGQNDKYSLWGLNRKADLYEQLELHEGTPPLTSLHIIYNEQECLDDEYFESSFHEQAGRLETISREHIQIIRNSDYSWMSQIDADLADDEIFIVEALTKGTEDSVDAFEFASERLKLEVGSNDPIEYFKKKQASENLEKELPNKSIKDPMTLRDEQAARNNNTTRTKSNKLKI